MCTDSGSDQILTCAFDAGIRRSLSRFTDLHRCFFFHASGDLIHGRYLHEGTRPGATSGSLCPVACVFSKTLAGSYPAAGDLLPQLKESSKFDYNGMRSGALLFTLGLFKKVVIADHLAGYVNVIYDDVHSYTGLPLIIATYAYAFQILFDFSGYTDMARGTARMFGINLTENLQKSVPGQLNRRFLAALAHLLLALDNETTF